MTTPAEESVSGVNEQELLTLVGRTGWDITARDKVTAAPDPVLPNGDEAWTIKGPNGQLEEMVVTPTTGPDSGAAEYKLAPNGSPHAVAYGVMARPVGSTGCVSNGWMVYVGVNSWIHDPGRPTSCRDESTIGR
jgi:hypothetical protein